uniref:Uncharacterized protein n=1 Tax=Molossus molossus TaxID=27622 RepID=A0A7J8J7J4_MOLMO|nr:hypothetical protein HJG59_009623 [Molossus molossus]
MLLLLLRKTLILFWKDYNIYDCMKNTDSSWGDVTKEGMNGLWKTTLKRFIHDFKEIAKDEEVAKTNKVMVYMANNFNLSVDKNDIEEPLEVVPEELTNEDLLELEQQHRDEEETRDNKLQEK